MIPEAASISVVRVRDVLLVTLPADPDDGAVDRMQARVLEALEQRPAQGVILDISAVDTVDSFFARTIAETGEMVGLMGGRTVVAGMQPAVAITATQLGLTLGVSAAALDVDHALDLLTGPAGARR